MKSCEIMKCREVHDGRVREIKAIGAFLVEHIKDNKYLAERSFGKIR
jgi:hypothetical protein